LALRLWVSLIVALWVVLATKISQIYRPIPVVIDAVFTLSGARWQLHYHIRRWDLCPVAVRYISINNGRRSTRALNIYIHRKSASPSKRNLAGDVEYTMRHIVD
jgi:hypothetical protein